MKIYTTITNVAFHYALKEDALNGETEWSINRRARPEQMVLLYVCAPVSAISATAFIAESPYLEEDVISPFFNTYFAKMDNLKMLDVAITRHQMRELFPDWGYWLQPRNSIAVPAEFQPRVLDLFGELKF